MFFNFSHKPPTILTVNYNEIIVDLARKHALESNQEGTQDSLKSGIIVYMCFLLQNFHFF